MRDKTMIRGDGQYQFKHILMSYWYQRDQGHRLENKLAIQLLLRKVASKNINASHSSIMLKKTVVSVETYTVSGIYWIRYEKHLEQ